MYGQYEIIHDGAVIWPKADRFPFGFLKNDQLYQSPPFIFNHI